MPLSDEFPELYFPDGNGDFVWEKSGWEDSFSDNDNYFSTFGEAVEWAKSHPYETITRSPDGYGFIKKNRNMR